MNNSYKHIALGSVFLVLVLLSVYMVIAAATEGWFFLNISPTNQTFTSDTTPQFEFNISGNATTYNASLYISGIFNGSINALNATTVRINTSSTLTDGEYTWYINATNGTGANWTNTYTITIDNTLPTINYQGLTPENNSYRAIPSIFINVTATDTNFNKITFYLYNSTPTQINSTEVLSNRNPTINFTALSDGVYTYNATAVDNATNKNVSIVKTITLDTTAPSSATVTAPSSDTEFGADATITCARADATAGINNTVLVITKPNANTITIRDINVTSSATRSYTLSSGSTKDLNELGTYKADCTVKDRAGNSLAATQKTFVVSSSGSGDSGGGSGTSVITHTLGTVNQEGITKLIRNGDRARFTLGGTQHTATITNVGTDSVTIKLESDPITLTLDVGETK
ncbi:MAG: hypothetical protein KJ767_00545, partial [Nanoarchaeota archaeon]|nr:hypothetical protein [Nanoarchaeota archaeon]